MKVCISCNKEKENKKVSYKGPTCNSCARRAYRLTHPEQEKAYYHKRASDPEVRKKQKVWNKSWEDRNKEHREKYVKEYYETNKELISEKGKTVWKANRKAAVEKYQATGKYRAAKARRRAAELKALPKWANLQEIREIYLKCPKGFEVDHAIPLQGKNVCGLHVPENLQYLSKADNRKKSNRFEYV